MTDDCTLFINGYQSLKEPNCIKIADGSYMESVRLGTIRLTLKGFPQQDVTVLNMLYVLKLVTNLMSIIQLEECSIAIATNSLEAMNLLYKGKMVGHTTRVG